MVIFRHSVENSYFVDVTVTLELFRVLIEKLFIQQSRFVNNGDCVAENIQSLIATVVTFAGARLTVLASDRL